MNDLNEAIPRVVHILRTVAILVGDGGDVSVAVVLIRNERPIRIAGLRTPKIAVQDARGPITARVDDRDDLAAPASVKFGDQRPQRSGAVWIGLRLTNHLAEQV